MFGDVGDPKLVRFAAGEAAVDEVFGCRCLRARPRPARTQKSLNASAIHQQLDSSEGHQDASTESQFSHTSRAIDAWGGRMNLGDHPGQPQMAHSAGGRTALEPGVVARVGDPEDVAGTLHRQLLSGHHIDGRKPAFGSTTVLSNSAARWWIASSASSSRILRRAATSSACSRDVKPGRRPASI